MTVRRMMGFVAIIGLCLALADEVKVRMKAATYQRKAEAYERRERRCREIDATDSETRSQAAAVAYDDPFLDNPSWNRQMIPYLESLKKKYFDAAAHPRRPLAPDPPVP
jgi:hypothetical protein